MTDKMTLLAKRAVACKGWRWVPGMATVQGERVVLMDDDGTLRLAAPWGGTVGVTAVRSFFDSSGACLPDLTDPATLGCLLALVREAWGDERTAVKWWEPEGCAYYAHPLDTWRPPATLFASEAEALVAALESAP